ncbi:hypothetical protein S245_052415 [Arachis hypogaea]
MKFCLFVLKCCLDPQIYSADRQNLVYTIETQSQTPKVRWVFCIDIIKSLLPSLHIYLFPTYISLLPSLHKLMYIRYPVSGSTLLSSPSNILCSHICVCSEIFGPILSTFCLELREEMMTAETQLKPLYQYLIDLVARLVKLKIIG